MHLRRTGNGYSIESNHCCGIVGSSTSSYCVWVLSFWKRLENCRFEVKVCSRAIKFFKEQQAITTASKLHLTAHFSFKVQNTLVGVCTVLMARSIYCNPMAPSLKYHTQSGGLGKLCQSFWGRQITHAQISSWIITSYEIWWHSWLCINKFK